MSTAPEVALREADRISVEVIQAWPRRHQTRHVQLSPGSTAAQALAAAGIQPGQVAGLAIYGERIRAEHVLADGDRVEVLRALEVDPKQARRLRAAARGR